MSAGPGEIEVQGITEVQGEKVFVLRFIQGRNKDGVSDCSLLATIQQRPGSSTLSRLPGTSEDRISMSSCSAARIASS